MNHIVAISGGKDSVAMALMLDRGFPHINFIYAITPTGNELPEMKEHWRYIEQLLHHKLLDVGDGLTLEKLIMEHGMLPNWRSRFCTRIIKIQRFQKWVSDHAPAIVYVGLRADEENREGGIYDNIDGVNVSFPLREAGWDKARVIEYLNYNDVKIPRRTDCAICFFQTVWEWWLLWRDYPEMYQQGIDWEDHVSTIRGKRCTFRNEKKDSWGTSLRELLSLIHI